MAEEQGRNPLDESNPPRNWERVSIPDPTPPIAPTPKEVALPLLPAPELSPVRRATGPPTLRERNYRERLEGLASKILLAVVANGYTGDGLHAARQSVAIAQRLLAAVDAAEVPGLEE